MSPTRKENGDIFFEDHPEFVPNLTPEEVLRMGSFGGTYYRDIKSDVTKKEHKNTWEKLPKSWIKGLDPEKYLARKWEDYDKNLNKYKVKVGSTLELWEEKGWIKEENPYGWFDWYVEFYQGKRCSDDERQIKRYKNINRFKKMLFGMIKKKEGKINDFSISPKIRQTLQHWAYKPTLEDYNSYLNL